MKSKYTRLDRFISKTTPMSQRDVRIALAKKRIYVDGEPATNINQVVGPFSHIALDGKALQKNTPLYIMLNKPEKIVSATKDDKHITVLDIIYKQKNTVSPEIEGNISEWQNTLHIAGRLDYHSTGLVLITNDGRWSRELSSPKTLVTKQYIVTLEKPLTEEYVDAFAKGMHFAYENIITRPAKLEILDDYTAKVALTEGKYHQIKRMFGRFQNKVLTLHRISVGNLHLDSCLKPGQYRHLTPEEITSALLANDNFAQQNPLQPLRKN